MRFERLRLAPYGAFEDLTLDFDPRARLHVVYGPNGAGKTTTLGALDAVLYEMRPSDRAFRYGSTRLRLGATIVAEDGTRLEFVRRTKRTAPLWNADDTEPLPQDALEPFLAGLDQTRYRTLFGLDITALQAGGRSLLAGDDVGDALFGAALGASQLAAVRKALADEREALFVKNGKNPTINALESERRDKAKEAREAILTATAYDAERKLLSRAEEQRRDRARERAEARVRAERLRALAKAAEDLARRREWVRERDAYGEGEAPLDGDVAREVLGLVQSRDAAAKALVESRGQVAEYEAQLEALETRRRPDVRSRATRILALAKERAVAEAQARRAQALAEELEDARSQRTHAAGRGGLGVESEGAVEVGPGDLAELQRHQNAVELAESRLADAEEQLEEHRDEAERLERAHERFDAGANGRYASELRALAPFGGTVSELAALEVPSAGRIEGAVAREAEARAQADRAAERRVEAEARVRTAEEAFARAVAAVGGRAPSEDEIVEARAQRDAALEAALAEEAPDARTGHGVAGAVRAADTLADRRIELGDAAAQQRSAESSLEESRAGLGTALEADEAARTALADAAALRDELFEELGLAWASAAELAEWLDAREALLSRVDVERTAARRAADEATDRAARATRTRDERTATLAEARATFGAWADARGLAPELGFDELRTRLEAHGAVAGLTAQIASVRSELEAARAAVAAFAETASALAEELSVHATPTPPHALGEEFAWASVRVEALEAALVDAEKAESEVQGVHSALEPARRLLARQEDEAREARGKLDALAEAHTAGNLDALLARAERQAAHARVVDRIEELDRALARAFDGLEPSAIEEEIAERSAAALGAEAEAAAERAEELGAEIDALGEEIGRLRPSVEGDRPGRAAELDAEVAGIEADLARAAERYVHLTTAEFLLEREIRRYRDEAQAPLLRRAEELFVRLTGGAYSRLLVTEDRGKERIVAKRPSGEEVPLGRSRGDGERSRPEAAGVSEGTCDQVYLALRIATVERALERREPMPFVADDLFVHFDDARTSAGLEILAELGRTTQVVLFTHHAHVLELARGLPLGPGELDVLELPAEGIREARAIEE